MKTNQHGREPRETYTAVVVGLHTEYYCKGNRVAYHSIVAAHQSKLAVLQPSQNYPKNPLHRKTACAGQMIEALVEG